MNSNSPICDGALSLSGTEISGMTDVASWSWSGPCGFSSDQQNVNLSDVDPNCAGTYTLIATSSAGCSTTSSIEVEISNIPDPTLMNECDEVICVGDNCFLIGTNYANSMQQFNWSATPDTGAGLPANTDDNILMITPTEPGTYVYNYSVVVDGCETSIASVTITVEGAPEGVDDQFSTAQNVSLQNTVIANDVFNSELNPRFEIIDPANNGLAQMDPTGSFNYIPADGFIGTDEFTYQICHDCTELSCDTATVSIEVVFEGECRVPNLISPNGDGINDLLKILCLETGEYPDNEIIIFNMWGDEVFQANPYQNNWDGTLNGDGSSDLPDGTYYYIFREDSGQKGEKGYITILR